MCVRACVGDHTLLNQLRVAAAALGMAAIERTGGLTGTHMRKTVLSCSVVVRLAHLLTMWALNQIEPFLFVSETPVYLFPSHHARGRQAMLRLQAGLEQLSGDLLAAKADRLT